MSAAASSRSSGEPSVQAEEHGLAHGLPYADRKRGRHELLLDEAASPLFGAALKHDELRCGNMIGHGILLVFSER